jgi:protoporphyrin/coproporphyrin ferrochelatase
MNAPTGIVMMNLGGPKTVDDVGPFLLKLFEDREIIQLPVQNLLGPWIAKRRTAKVQKLYQGIGGGSPILHWTEEQGQGMCERLDRLSPESAPHKFYVAFRYVTPFSEDALKQMKADGVKRAIAFTQYPQFSCSTTGSSMNELWRAAKRVDLHNEFQWSIIDRWGTHPKFIDAMTKTVRDGLAMFDPKDRDDTLIMFSAHSLPLDVINRGDAYPQEIGASVHEVMKQLEFSHEYMLCYQSDVGPVPWQGPSTEEVIKNLGEKKRKNVLVVGIAFTSDHIETLSEIDLEYAELAHEVGITNFKRAPALNGESLFKDALAQVVLEHLQSGEACTRQYGLRCPGCVNPQCRNILNPVAPYKRTNVSSSPKNKQYANG